MTAGIWRRGMVLAALAVLLALVMLLHAQIPNTIGNLGSLTETFLPWLGLFVPVLLVLALVRRSATALIAVLLPGVVWLNLFGGLLTDKTGSGGDLTVATHNVNADNPDPAGTARDVAASGADVVALEELTADGRPGVREGARVDVSVPLGAGHRRAVEQVPAERRRGRSTSSWAGRARCGPRSTTPDGRGRRVRRPSAVGAGQAARPGSPPASATRAPTRWARPSPTSR